MSRSEKMIGPMSLVWTLGVPVATLAFMAGVLNLGAALARWTGSQVAMVLFLPASALLGIAAWQLVLYGAWWLRRYYLRRTGIAQTAVVVKSELRRKHARALFDFDLWQVQVAVELPHPDTNSVVQVEKRFLYPQFREAKARALAERLGIGCTAPLLVKQNYALFDVPKRPVWTDIW